MLPQSAMGLTGGLHSPPHVASHPPAGEPGLFHLVAELTKQQELKVKCFFRPRLKTCTRSLLLYSMIKASNKTRQHSKDEDTNLD